MENYEIMSDGTRREIKGIELFCELYPRLSMAIFVILIAFIIGAFLVCA